MALLNAVPPVAVLFPWVELPKYRAAAAWIFSKRNLHSHIHSVTAVMPTLLISQVLCRGNAEMEKTKTHQDNGNLFVTS